MTRIRLLGKRLHVYPIYPKGDGPIVIPEKFREGNTMKLWYVMGTSPNVTEVKKGDWIVSQCFVDGPYPVGDGSFFLDYDQVVAIIVGGVAVQAPPQSVLTPYEKN